MKQGWLFWLAAVLCWFASVYGVLNLIGCSLLKIDVPIPPPDTNPLGPFYGPAAPDPTSMSYWFFTLVFAFTPLLSKKIRQWSLGKITRKKK